jgi:hypothetical protein
MLVVVSPLAYKCFKAEPQGANWVTRCKKGKVDVNFYLQGALEPFKELGLDSQRVKKLASKLHVHSVNYAGKLVHTRRTLSGTIIYSHQETVSDQACNPPDPH